MPFNVAIQQSALDEIFNQPLTVRKIIHDHLLLLAQSPNKVRVPSQTPPEPAGYMKHAFDFMCESSRLSISVHSKYFQDEQTIEIAIVHITQTFLPPSPP